MASRKVSTPQKEPRTTVGKVASKLAAAILGSKDVPAESKGAAAPAKKSAGAAKAKPATAKSAAAPKAKAAAAKSGAAPKAKAAATKSAAAPKAKAAGTKSAAAPKAKAATKSAAAPKAKAVGTKSAAAPKAKATAAKAVTASRTKAGTAPKAPSGKKAPAPRTGSPELVVQKRQSRTVPSEGPGHEAALAAAHIAAAAALDKKAADVLILDVAGLNSYADCFVIASGSSDRQVSAIADAIEEKMKKAGHRVIGVEGHGLGHWILLDFADVVVHVFFEEVRAHYDVEGLWSDAKRIPVG